MLITLNTNLEPSIEALRLLYLVFKSNQWFDLWFTGLQPIGCRSKVDLIHTDPNQTSESDQTYRFRSQSPTGRPTFSLSAQFRLGLATYAEKQARIFEGLARRSAGCWITYLKTILEGQLPAWLHPYAAFARKVRPRKFSKESGEIDEDSSDEEEEWALAR